MLRNRSFLISEYLVQTKKKWFASSGSALQLQDGLDKIFTLYTIDHGSGEKLYI